MDIVIVKGAFNDMYWDNAPLMFFIIQVNVIKVYEIDWSILETFFFGIEPPISSDTLLKSWCSIIIFQKGYMLIIHPSDIF